MKRKMSVGLFAGMIGFSLHAGTIFQPEWTTEADLKAWKWNAAEIARLLPGGILELHLDQPAQKHVHGISHAIDAAKIAGKRITISAEVKRDIKVYQKWQGGKLMLSVKYANGKYDYFGFYMEPGIFDWKKLVRSFDIPQDIISASLFLGLQGATGTIQYRNLKLETGDTVLDLTKNVNMGYADPVANDGKGGWSDQGPDNDGSKFRWKQTTVANVPFRLLDPAKNGGKAVMTFANKRLPAGIESTGLDLSGGSSTANWFYLLHTLTFPDSYAPVGQIEIAGSKGAQTLKIVNGRDIANWWMPSRKPNAFPALLWTNGGGNQVGVYLSRFKLNDLGTIRSVTFRKETGSTANWIVIAATLSEKKYDLPENERFAPVAGKEWKVLPLPQKGGVIAGSALDISFLNDGKPTGTYGRVIINKDGHFAFEKAPDRPVRFIASAEAAASFRGHWTARPQFDTKEKTREYVRQLRMAGYNMIRIHFLDELLLMKAEKDLDFNSKILDNFCYLLAECGKNGIYINIDAMTCRLGYSKGKRWGWSGSPKTPGNFKFAIYYSERVRRNWKDGVRKLFTYVNPYTGKRMIDDPTIAMVVGYNEQEFALSPGFRDTYAPLLPQWKAFLKQKYGTPQALANAWKGAYDAPASFDQLAIFGKDDVFRTDAYGTDINRFLEKLENDIFHFYKNSLREIGYKGPVSAMNMGKTFRNAISRRDYDFISMNSYHAHPNGYASNKNGGSGSIEQGSSIGNAANIIRGFISMRRYLAPYVITEHLHVFWNRYRYEQAFVTGAYSAYQDIDGLTGFGSGLTVNDYSPMIPFLINNDPIAKSQELLTALLFRRRDVSPGKSLIRLTLSSDEILKGASYDALSTAQGKLILTSRFAYTCDTKLPLKKNETILGRSGSSGLVLDAWYTNIADTKDTSFDLDSYLNSLRSKGALPENNRSSDAKGIFETDTGELRMDIPRNYMQIDTPRLQGVCAEAGTKAKLRDFEVRNMTTRGNVALISIDGTRPIRDAKRLLLVLATNALNSNMLFEDKEMRFMLKGGKMPILLQTGRFEVAFRNGSAVKMKAYALRMNGERLAELLLKRNGSELVLSVDTAALPAGPAIYYELTAN